MDKGACLSAFAIMENWRLPGMEQILLVEEAHRGKPCLGVSRVAYSCHGKFDIKGRAALLKLGLHGEREV